MKMHTLALVSVLMQLGGAFLSMWVRQPSGARVDFRSVRAIDTQVAWASGGMGFARTQNGGKTWYFTAIPAGARCDFWLHASTSSSAMIGSVVPPARIYRTTNEGRTWDLQFEDHSPGVRLLGGAFWDQDRGMFWGDPVKGSFQVYTSTDGGGVWHKTPSASIPVPLAGEFGLGQGTLQIQGRETAWFGTGGGAIARVFRTTDGGSSWLAAPTQIPSARDSGIVSVAFRDGSNGIAMGGNLYATSAQVMSKSTDGGATWSRPFPVRSRMTLDSIVFVPRTGTLVGVGRAGSAFSTDGGYSWKTLGDQAFSAVSFAGPVDAGWAVGANGLIAKYVSGVGRGNSLRSGYDSSQFKTELYKPGAPLKRVMPTPEPDAKPHVPLEVNN